jgi:haloacetate dehalogenase
MAFFKGFELEHVDVGEATLRVRHGGEGPPVVLLHGHPRTHATWHRVAALLAPRFSVVCPDLRGYGRSTKPATRDDHSQSSKRAMAEDVRHLMEHLGHDRFAVVGHDRGSAVAYRLALDHPEAVTSSWSWTASRSGSTSSERMRGSRRRGGTGSSSPRRRSRQNA